MKKLGPISLPQDFPNDYSRRLNVMLYQYLREISQQVNELMDSIGGITGGSAVSGSLVMTVPSGGRYEHEETISAASVTAAMKIVLALAPHADSDENHEQMIDLATLSGEAGAGQITVRASFGSLTSGPIRINYIGV